MPSETDAASVRIVNSLVEADALTAAEEGGLRFTEQFAGRLTESRNTVTEADGDTLITEFAPFVADQEKAERFLELDDVTNRILAEYLALARTVQDLSHSDRLRALTLFDAIGESPPPERGAPNGFIPVTGDRLPFLLDVYPRVVVYIWLDDCDDCDVMEEVLAGIDTDRFEDITTLSVYGPDAAKLLHEEYSVPGGPATLFVLDGDVDARLYGCHDHSIVENQIETLREL